MRDKQLPLPGLPRTFWRGCVQVAFWPLFRPALWRLRIREISTDLSPGFAWLDIPIGLLLHNRQLRRLAGESCCIWLIPILLAFIANGIILGAILANGEARWEGLSFGTIIAVFSATVALGLSAAASSAASTLVSVLVVILCAMRWYHFANHLTLLAILSSISAFVAARFKSLQDAPGFLGRLVRIVMAVPLAIVAWLISGIVPCFVLLALFLFGAIGHTILSRSLAEGLGWLDLVAVTGPQLVLGPSFASVYYVAEGAVAGLAFSLLYAVIYAVIGRFARKW